jgi:hypothetical protein
MFDYEIYSKKSYSELVTEQNRLEEKYEQVETECLNDNLTFAEFCNKVHDVKERLFMVDKFMRLKRDPILTYGKEWSGHLYEINNFKEMCEHEMFTDDDGIGYYATETAKSDIIIRPSDFDQKMVREDFTHVLWFNK